MCGLCEGRQIMKCEDMSIKIEGNIVEVNYNPIFTGDNNATERFAVNYCLNCGQPLTKKG